MFNDTNLNNRQKVILKVLEEKNFLSRLELANNISLESPVSRITFIRDLNFLIKLDLVVVSGKGKNTRYGLKNANSVLAFVDIDEYFKKVDRVGEKKEFNKEVFALLKNLYSPDEIELWEKSKKMFAKAQKELDPSIYKRELERFVIEFSWKSSQIEGNTYSLIETETLIKEKVRARGHPEEEAIMILNHKDAFDRILKNKNSFRQLSVSDIMQLHQVLTKSLVSSGIRNQQVRISGTDYIPPANKSEIELLLKQLITLTNRTNYPPEKALIVSLILAYLQPFADGNKRKARMLANALLLAHNFLPLSYRSVDVNEYRSAMIIFYETNNLYCYKQLFMKQLQFALDSYFR